MFCSRKGGATIKGKFYPRPTVSAIMADAMERVNNKMEARTKHRNRY